MIEVTQKDIVDFIFSQPDDKVADLSQNLCEEECGCLMVHYGRAQNWEFLGCSFFGWVDEEGHYIAKFTSADRLGYYLPKGVHIHEKVTYGELKGGIMQKGIFE